MERCHKSLPLLLAGHAGKSGHSIFPIEVKRGINNHNKLVTCNVYLHLKYADGVYSLTYLSPKMLLVMGLAIATDKFGIITKTHRLNIPLHGLVVIFCLVSFHK